MNAPQEFIDAYIVCALWTEEEDLTAEGAETVHSEIATYSLSKMHHDCAIFWTAAKEHIGENVERAGHDFWLTRNGHGAGFWDRPEVYGEENAKWLTELASAFGAKTLVVGGDQKIHYE